MLDRPNLTFMQGKYRVFNEMCYATFCAHYVLDNKKDKEVGNDWQPVILNEIVNELCKSCLKKNITNLSH